MEQAVSDHRHLLVENVSSDRVDLILHRPDTRNALSEDLVDSLRREIDTAAQRERRLVVLRAAPPAFSSGFDLSSLEKETDATLLWRFTRIGLLLEELMTAPFTSVAVLDGPAVGAGADLALACDIRIGTPRASFRFPGASFGVVLGVHRLAHVLGQAAALDLLATGRKLEYDAAVRGGVLRAVANADDIDSELDALCTGAQRLTAGTMPKLVAAARTTHPDAQLAHLVRSVSGHSGIADRLRDYVASTQRSRTTSRLGDS